MLQIYIYIHTPVQRNGRAELRLSSFFADSEKSKILDFQLSDFFNRFFSIFL
jgi:hypothetical protein